MADGNTERSLKQQLRELTTLNEVIRTLTSTLELHEILRIVLDRLKSLTQAEGLSLLLYDATRDELVFAATETLQENTVVGLRVPALESVASWVARTGKSAIVRDVQSDARFYSGIDRMTKFRTKSLLSVPLRRRDQVIGVLEVVNRYGSAGFDEADRGRLEALAAEVSSGDLDELSRDAEAMRALLTRTVTAVPSEAASLLLLDPVDRQLVFRASRAVQPGIIEGLRLPCRRGIAGWVARHRQAVRLDDVQNDSRYYSGLEQQTQLVPKTMICVPMISKDTLRGVIQVINKVDGTAFSEAELHFAQTIADHAAIAIENASLYQRAYEASITDDLTGLGNTRFFNLRLPDLIAQHPPVSLIVFDLDSFKAVVDGYGHLVGSRTIAHIGKLVGQLLRPGDVAARFGGDEFVIALPDTDLAAALEVAERVRSTVESCRELPGENVDLTSVTASVGVATFPDHAADAESLFRAADGAMYGVKRSGKNRVGAVGTKGGSLPGEA